MSASKLGSMEHAADVARGVLLERAYSFLTAIVGGLIASFGESCWLTSAALAERITMPNGRKPHPESVARVRRLLRDDGVIQSERVFVNGKLPTHAKYERSTRGTTINAFIWRAVSKKSPFSRRERQLARFEQARKLRKAGELQKRPAREPQTAPRHSAPPPSPVPAPRIVPAVQRDPEIDRMAAEIQALQERNAAARAARAGRAGSEPVSGLARPAAERGPPE